MAGRVRQALRSSLFGPAGFREQCAIGLPSQQHEVSVWLHGLAAPLDVTYRHAIAAAKPLTIGIGLDSDAAADLTASRELTLSFRECGPANRLLGEIDLRPVDRAQTGAAEHFCTFEVRGCRNYCASRTLQLQRSLAWHYQRLRQTRANGSAVQPTALESRCLGVLYICPRPVVLVSSMNGGVGNIFPMDLIGPIGPRSFSLALHNSRAGAPLLESSRRIAVSNVPIDRAPVAYELGKNHRKSSVDWNQLPFARRDSVEFHLPVPEFAVRVREMAISSIRSLGSYKLFLAEVVDDYFSNDSLQLHFIHGTYQAWRARHGYSGSHEDM